ARLDRRRQGEGVGRLVARSPSSQLQAAASVRRNQPGGVSAGSVGSLRHARTDGCGARVEGVLPVLTTESGLGRAASANDQAGASAWARPGSKAVPEVRRGGRTPLQRHL